MALRGMIVVALVFLASTLAHFILLVCLRKFYISHGGWRSWVVAFLVKENSVRDLLSSAALFSVADLPLLILTLDKLAAVKW